MHWIDQFAPSARVDSVVHPATDPCSGQPASRLTPAKRTVVTSAWKGFLYTRRLLTFFMANYRVRSRQARFRVYEPAGYQPLTDSSFRARQ